MSVQPDLGGAATRGGMGRARLGSVPRAATAHPARHWPVPAWAKRYSVGLAVSATLVVHGLSLTRRLGIDEGGFAMVARHWHDGGRYLYGPEWVDRPPGLIGLFAVADHLGPYGVRLTAMALAGVLVGALAWAAEAVGGRPAARWAAWAGFAFASSVLLGALELNGELAAATFVTIAVGAVLRAVRVSRSLAQTAVLGAVGGVTAMVAVLMKQNFVDAFVFAAVLVCLGLATPANRRIYRPIPVLTTIVAFVAGAAVPASVTAAWALRHGGIGALLYAVLGFRADAVVVMARWSLAAPLHRLDLLAVVACLSGLLLLVGHLVVSHGRRLLRLDPLPWAVAATAATETFGVLAGANFWSHYLIALIPMVALAAGLSVNSRAPGATRTRRLIVLAACITAVVSPVVAIRAAHRPSAAYTTGRWVAAAAHPRDTIVVPLTHANVINASGLEPGYPYAWSLPARTLDPHLVAFTRTLDGSAAPTWVVRWDAGHLWGLDPGNHVATALRTHYRSVADVCGHIVWLHDGIRRHLAPPPLRSACGRGAA